MASIYHFSGGSLQRPGSPKAICHCILLESGGDLVLIDAGIGLADVADPEGRFGKELIELAGFNFHENETVFRQIEKLGLDPRRVRHIIMSHLDPDHAGGLADFPEAIIHVAEEELAAFRNGHPRYLPIQLAHNPQIRTYSVSVETWRGFEIRRVPIEFPLPIYLVPLFGHTAGHCGVLIHTIEETLFYTADAYYLRTELFIEDHPVTELARANAIDDGERINSLERIKKLRWQLPERVNVFGYHDELELEGFLFNMEAGRTT